MTRFNISLLSIHKAKNVSVYRVCKDTGLASNTVRRYLAAPTVTVDRLDGAVLQMAKYYGVDWRTVVEAVEDTYPENKTPLLIPA